MTEPEMHELVRPLAFLLGTWRGTGTGEYPTIQTFEYGEEVHFWHVGKPMLAYTQRTWALDDKRPLHAEMGYWRPQRDGRIELVIAHPTGVVEIETGTIDGKSITLETTRVVGTESAKEVNHLTRTFHGEGDKLRYRVGMAAVGVPLTHHLAATLVRDRSHD